MHRSISLRACAAAALIGAAAPAPARAQHEQHTMPAMAASRPLGIPMERMGSGTSWIPEAAPLPGRHRMLGAWDLMLHGFADLQYDHQQGPRGDAQLGSLNWAMLMAGRPAGGGRFDARLMLSLDPATVGAEGYPLLLQSGETYGGAPIHDRQHPHDFWMEVGLLYERALAPSLGMSLYAAPVGEPALGPPAFMHRASAMDNPFAPLAHHWQDATHVTFGVVTAGVFGRRWKLEGSAFNGREPDESRWDFDPIRLDSWSGRLTVNPTPQWSLTAGVGRLESPERLHPEESVRRATAAVLWGAKLGGDGQIAATLAWGANRHEDATTHAWTLEGEATLGPTHVLFARADLAQKSAGDLGAGSSEGIDGETFTVAAISLGGVRELGRFLGVTAGFGGRGTLNLVPERLAPIYGSRRPLGAVVFLRVRPFAEGAMAAMPGT